MSVRIGHASIDENGRAYGGQPGDQTGREVCIRSWYNRPWTLLLRPVSRETAERMAAFCEGVCKNANVGYNQYQRNSLREAAKAAGWDPAKIGRCDTDCSAFMTVCAEAAGVDVSGCYTYGNAPVTQTMGTAFPATGAFTALRESKYLTGTSYLRRGDILVYEPGHTVMVLDDGDLVKEEEPKLTKADLDRILADFRTELFDELDKRLLGAGSTPSVWAVNELQEAVERGITDGSRPKGYATREEVALMVNRGVDAASACRIESLDDGK